MSERADDRDWCPMGLSGTMRCEGPDPVLKAENAMLRELCERAVQELHVNGNVTDASTESLFDAMRELGIEVSK